MRTPRWGRAGELLEETGTPPRWERLGAYRPDGNPGLRDGPLLLALDAYPQAPDAGDLEEATVELVPLADCEARLLGGEMGELAPIACVALALAQLRRAGRL